MGALLSSVLFLGLGFASCGGITHVQSLGDVKLASLCDDPQRCEVKGDAYTNTLEKKGAPRLYLANGQGPEQYLGKVAPKREVLGALSTCGKGVQIGDWLNTAPTLRVLKLDADGKIHLRATLRAQLAHKLSEHAVMREDAAEKSVEETVDSVLAQVVPRTVTVHSETYWLSDLAFEKRVALCGEENYEDIIYSVTVLELSPMFQRDLEVSLKHALAAALRVEVSAPSKEHETDPLGVLPGTKEVDGQSARAPLRDKAKEAPTPNDPKPGEDAKASDVPEAGKKPVRRARARKVTAEAVAASPTETPEVMAVPEVNESLPLTVQPLAPAENKQTAADGSCTACADIARATIQSLAEDTRLIMAVGFDER